MMASAKAIGVLVLVHSSPVFRMAVIATVRASNLVGAKDLGLAIRAPRWASTTSLDEMVNGEGLDGATGAVAGHAASGPVHSSRDSKVRQSSAQENMTAITALK